MQQGVNKALHAGNVSFTFHESCGTLFLEEGKQSHQNNS